jgi:hypothetical protein
MCAISRRNRLVPVRAVMEWTTFHRSETISLRVKLEGQGSLLKTKLRVKPDFEN